MARIIMELTNRCNLRCLHCYDERHAATGDISMKIIDKVLEQGKDCGIEHLAFTGGEPTLHHSFAEIVHRVCETGYSYSFVSNGINFSKVYRILLEYRSGFIGLTFSLDGAQEETHDKIRGKGSYRRLMSAVSLCVFNQLPFTVNMVVTATNRGQVAEMVRLSEKLGSQGVRFGFLMFNQETARAGLDLSPQESREVQEEIHALQETSDIAVGMAPGFFSESPFYPCGPLEIDEFNLDYKGNLSLCCQLSGYPGSNPDKATLGNLHEIDLTVACDRFRQLVKKYLDDKQAKLDSGGLSELDHFPCFYCLKYLGQLSWLDTMPQHPWGNDASIKG